MPPPTPSTAREPDLLVTSGCQSGAVAAALGGMLPDRQVLALPLPEHQDRLAAALARAEVWVTSLDDDQVDAWLTTAGARPQVVRIPNVYFPAFHPDILHVVGPDGHPLPSAVGPYSSATVLWGWMHGYGRDEILGWFRPDTWSRLEYTLLWDGALQLMRERFAASDLDLGRWLLPLARRGVFMLTDNHPTVGALVELARQVAEILGAAPEVVAVDWERLIPDGLLATAAVWPLYPGIAENLGLVGGYVWRATDGRLLGLEAFVTETLAGYRGLDPDRLDVPRFRDDPRFAAALGSSVGAGG